MDDETDSYINKEFKKAEKEDIIDETAFKNMQEIYNENLGFNKTMTREDYVSKIQAEEV